MKQVRRTLPRLLRLLALTALCRYRCCPGAGQRLCRNHAAAQGRQSGRSPDQGRPAIVCHAPRSAIALSQGCGPGRLGQAADAVATFTKLTEDYPELPEPYNNLAVLYANQNQLDKARTALEMAIRTNPSYATAHENPGRHLRQAGQPGLQQGTRSWMRPTPHRSSSSWP